MLKILIVDDEVKICNLIEELISRSGYDCEIVGIVNESISALEFINMHEVDLLFTDIRMPGYTGLELIQNIRKVKEDIYIIIISGYGQFDYAQQAIQYGVDDYLLKPIRKNELYKAVEKIIAKKEKQVEILNEHRNMVESIERVREENKENIFVKYLEHFHEQNGKELELLFENKEADWSYQAVIIRLITLDSAKRRSKALDHVTLTEGIRIVRRQFEKSGIDILSAIHGHDIYCVLNGDKNILDHRRVCLRRIRAELEEIEGGNGHVRVWISEGYPVEQVYKIYESLEEAECAMKDRLVNSSEEIMTVRNVDAAGWKSEEAFDLSDKQSFLNSLELFDLDAIQKSLDNIRNQIRQAKNVNGAAVEKKYFEIISMFRFACHKMGIELEDDNSYDTIMRRLDFFNSMEEMFAELSDYIIGNLEVVIEKRQNVDSKPIREAKQYINEFYYNSLTLEEVSTHVGFNASYFSSLFKKETGQTFSEYLSEVRIGYAKTFLMDMELSIADVAEKVGYNDKTYFSKLFKKNTGLTPKEYRRIYK